MVEISEIKDEDKLKAWLKDRPRAFSTAIAARSALRVLPVFWDWSLTEAARKGDLTALPILRSNLIAAVACKSPTAAIKTAAAADARATATTAAISAVFAAARAAADAVSAVFAVFADAVFAAARAAAVSVSAVFAVFADAISAADAVSAAAVSAAAADAVSAVWENIRRDCADLEAGRDLLQTLLWRDENPLADLWSDLRPKILSAENWQGGDWRFWVDWYDQMLDPATNPPNWELLEQVALIKPEVWDAGPKDVSEAIAAIQLGFAERALTTGERFEYDEGRDLFVRNPVPAEDKATLKYCVDRLSELSELAETMGNMQGILGGELFFIRRAVENHADNPVMVWDNCGNAMRMLQSNLASGACPAEEPYVTILQATLTDVRMRLQDDPAVQYVAPHRPSEVPVEDDDVVEAIAAAAELIIDHVEEDVAEELRQDVASLRDQFVGRTRKVAAFLTSAGRIVRIFIAGCYQGAIATLDAAITIAEKVEKLAAHAKGIVVKTGIGAVVGGGGAAAVSHSDKLSTAMEWISKLPMFGG